MTTKTSQSFFSGSGGDIRTYITMKPGKSSWEADKFPKQSCVLQPTHIQLNTAEQSQ